MHLAQRQQALQGRAAYSRQRVNVARAVVSRSRYTVAAATAAPAPAQASSSQERLEDQVAVVLGTQWGDEGKGKLVDILAQQYDIVARAQVRHDYLHQHYRFSFCRSISVPIILMHGSHHHVLSYAWAMLG